MGTNYYLTSQSCVLCGRGEGRKHIGKSSSGWVFSLHVYPNEGIHDLPNWKEKWSQSGVAIADEYGREVPIDEMVSIIEERKGTPKNLTNVSTHYRSWEHFHSVNQSLEGPKGLLQHKIGNFCTGHGDGTWDLCIGEFS